MNRPSKILHIPIHTYIIIFNIMGCLFYILHWFPQCSSEITITAFLTQKKVNILNLFYQIKFLKGLPFQIMCNVKTVRGTPLSPFEFLVFVWRMTFGIN